MNMNMITGILQVLMAGAAAAQAAGLWHATPETNSMLLTGIAGISGAKGMTHGVQQSNGSRLT